MSSSLADLEVLDSFADLDDDTGTFVTSTLGTKLGHLRQCPVVHHEVNIGQTETGSVELDENIVGTYSSVNVAP